MYDYNVNRLKKAIILSALSVLFIGTASIAAFALQPHTVAPTAPQTIISAIPKVQPPTVAELLSLVNKERAKNGVAPLIEDARLDASAQRKADDEVKYNYFGHVSPNDGKQGYTYIMDNAPGLCSYTSENLRQNGSVNSSQAVIDGWISSKPHHDAMISSNYSLTGFGISGNQIAEHFCQQ